LRAPAEAYRRANPDDASSEGHRADLSQDDSADISRGRV
jgi:hypothetical protein